VARNRKRAKERRTRRSPGQISRPGVATARGQGGVVHRDADRDIIEGDGLEGDGLERDLPAEDDGVKGSGIDRDPADRGAADRDGFQDEFERDDLEHDELNETPGPLEHAAPDVELAELQLALGRQQADREAASEPEPDDDDQDALGEADDDFAFEEGDDDYALDEGDDASDGGVGDADDGRGGGRALAPASARAAAARQLPGTRLINFLQGSWRELQRVHWPDRRQVMQATGVVIGFVIVAGIYLSIADTLSSKLVNLLLK
jgi:preprotein translocase SecE subunit